MRVLVLKAGATLLTLGTTALSSLYVTSHLKNPAAPLRPPVLSAGQTSTMPGPGGSLTIGPSVQPSNAQPVTSTYAS
ncbi:MAG: hypothetical protein ABI401_05790 [Candidatus Dormibacter sp.]